MGDVEGRVEQGVPMGAQRFDEGAAGKIDLLEGQGKGEVDSSKSVNPLRSVTASSITPVSESKR
jgi:hypothetical protein